MLLFILIIVAFAAIFVVLFAGLVQQQKEDYRIYGKQGESYKSFCNRFYTRWF